MHLLFILHMQYVLPHSWRTDCDRAIRQQGAGPILAARSAQSSPPSPITGESNGAIVRSGFYLQLCLHIFTQWVVLISGRLVSAVRSEIGIATLSAEFKHRTSKLRGTESISSIRALQPNEEPFTIIREATLFVFNIFLPLARSRKTSHRIWAMMPGASIWEALTSI
jgi:hypothetical protein